MSSSEKKRKPPESTQNPSLPDDLVVTCLARVSRIHYPTLSLVSKSFQSIIASPELYKTRSFLNQTETCLYVCLEFPSESNPRWFTLCQKPNQTLTNEKKKKKKKMSSGYVLIPISSPNSPPDHYDRGLVSVGSNIYAIGGSIKCGTDYFHSSSVSVLDCRSHMWHDAPSMLMKRNHPAGNVLDGKIYVTGGCEHFDLSNWMEVFDLKTQSWELLLCPLAGRCKRYIYKSAVVDGEIYIFGDKGVAYKPKEDRWEALEVNQSFDLEWGLLCYCVIENVLYSYTYSGGIKYYDTEVRYWMNVKGLEGFPKCAAYAYVKFADYGGKLAVFWDKYLRSSGYKSKAIWCAVISLDRSKTKEIWGKVEWLDVVLTVPHTYKFVDVLSVIL